MGRETPFAEGDFFDDGTGFDEDMEGGEPPLSVEEITVIMEELYDVSTYHKVVAGSHKTLRFTIKDGSGNLLDLPNEIEWTLSQSNVSEEPVLTKAVGGGITIVEKGVCDVALTPGDTLTLEGLYTQELKGRFAGFTSALFQGLLEVTPSVGGDVG